MSFDSYNIAKINDLKYSGVKKKNGDKWNYVGN